MTNAKTAPTPVRRERPRNAAHLTALTYAERGWPVLPGSVFNGTRFMVPGTIRATNGPMPLVPRNYASVDPHVIDKWWDTNSTQTSTVLLLSGEKFDVISVVKSLADLVMGDRRHRENPGPVAYRADTRRAYFLVTPETVQGTTRIGRHGEVECLESGSWILVPPAQLNAHRHVQWWVSPEDSAWRPASAQALVKTLRRMLGLPPAEGV